MEVRYLLEELHEFDTMIRDVDNMIVRLIYTLALTAFLKNAGILKKICAGHCLKWPGKKWISSSNPFF